MGFQLWIRPWWVVWLVTSAICVVPVLFWFLVVPGLSIRWSWAWGPLIIVGGSLVFGAVLVGLQVTALRTYRAAVAPLDSRAERSAAVRAVRYGGTPSDPSILAAAVRFGSVWESGRHRQQASWFTRASAWWVPIAFTALGVMRLVGGDVRQGVSFVVIAVLSAVLSVVDRRTATGAHANLEALRSAASEHAGLDLNVTALPRRPVWAAVAALMLIAVVGSVATTWLSRPPAGCDAADAVIAFVAADPIVQQIPGAPAAPQASAYSEWSDRIATYAEGVPADSPVAPHLRRIAGSARAAATAAAFAPHDATTAQGAYRQHVTDLIREEHVLIDICHPR